MGTNRSLDIRKNAWAFGLVVFVILSFDIKLSITDDNTTIPGIAYEFDLRSREDRAIMSVDELLRTLKKPAR